MKIGIGMPNQVRNVQARGIPAWAAAAESAGFSSLSSFGRLAYPGVADTVALATAAGVTTTIALTSSVLIAPVWPAALLAKELAGIDAVSGGRLTVGIGVGPRPDDFTSEELAFADRGRRLDRDLAIYRDVWDGKPFGNGDNPAVSSDARRIPMLFGGFAPAALQRMARWGEGYITGALAPELVVQSLDAARSAWRSAGRTERLRLVAMSYFCLGDEDLAHRNVHDYYSSVPDFAGLVSQGVAVGPAAVKERVAAFKNMGVDELIFAPTVDDGDDLRRLADAVL
ncbi:LLM class flavin-dependent oxidoreductase [Kribbella sindirgiensis]|uniref:LLM class flavin-dependent oxidoreductase n=1 Tax=Kribbella sindirgiensis TaxID=1124744 RepID=A0A4R0IMT8_9ACTN|nr:LLM class flavin-dependent oxidoreductase [Kribbella sindirgiensis]TCC34933.1 LLM class flavin-dependent oxidoreductase [Kribbella sindirgiensis]